MVGSIFAIIAFIAMFVFTIWLCILLPADMAKERNRSPLAWVLISLFASPLLAIILLALIGEAQS